MPTPLLPIQLPKVNIIPIVDSTILLDLSSQVVVDELKLQSYWLIVVRVLVTKK